MQEYRNTPPGRRRFLAGLACLAAAALAPGSSATSAQRKATLYRSPSCGCCGEYARYLKLHGFSVRTVATNDLESLRRRAGVPQELASCHTMLLEDYVVEGHVPVREIRRLLAERPNAVGIAVPGMPMGSPGMDGPRADPYEVLLFTRDARQSTYGRYGRS